MKCSRLKLAERTKTARMETRSYIPTNNERPRRYCQRRLVNPEHEEDPRWSIAALERFRCKISPEEQNEIDEQQKSRDKEEELFLSVMNINFQGNIQQSKRPRTCFKYKSVNNRHRMFIKQIVEDDNDTVEESQLSVNHYFDEYVKYILNNSERSRPSTAKSSIDRFSINNKGLESKVTQEKSTVDPKTQNTKSKGNLHKSTQSIKKDHTTDQEYNSDTKVGYYKTGKRKSLTISRAQSPETVQVIRVDVVCNNISTTSSIISVEDESFKEKIKNKSSEKPNLKDNNFAMKYLLTNTNKSLDQNICGGSKVTLLCKTFKMADRTRVYNIDNKRMPPKKHNIAWR